MYEEPEAPLWDPGRSPGMCACPVFCVTLTLILVFETNMTGCILCCYLVIVLCASVQFFL